jgi:WD40 repeat protein/serine/threonine protein kinase/tetratricopeptide (TPR) repeat protein
MICSHCHQIVDTVVASSTGEVRCPRCGGACASDGEPTGTWGPDATQPPRRAHSPPTEPPGSVADDPGRTAAFIPSRTASEGTDPAWPAVPGYSVLEELGSGGMGVVYLARQESLNRLVALKMIREAAQALPENRDRFGAEARAVARLQHPNIVQIYEVGEHRGLPFFALEYADGGSLAGHLTGTPQSADQAACLVETLARAMHYAHSRGIVHRDLKPANILLQEHETTKDSKDTNAEDREKETAYGSASFPVFRVFRGSFTPKITDFGLAKHLDDGSGQTRTGMVMGTPSYMAPEQADGRSKGVGPGADVYALGAILYEMLTGRPPFRAATAFDTVFQVLHDEPVAPRLLQPKVPRDLETVCLKCLQKDAGKRYGSAQDLAEDLGRFRAREPVRARPVGRVERLARWCRRHPGVAALTAVLIAVALGVMVTAVLAAARYREVAALAETEAEKSRQGLVRLHAAQGLRLMNDGDLLGALGPLARALEQDRGDPGREELHRARLAAVLRQCPRLIQAWAYDGTAVSAGFSPDGRHVLLAGARTVPAQDGVAAREEGEGIIWNVDTGEESRRAIPYAGRAREGRIALTADGRKLAAITSEDTFALQNAAGQTAKSLKHPTITFLAFSPNGRLLLTTGKDGKSRLWDTDAGREICNPLLHDGEVWHASFSPDGKQLVTASKDRTARIWDAARGWALTATLHHADSVNHAEFDPSGKHLVTITLRAEARVWDPATGNALTSLLPERDQLTPGGFSPAGSRPRAVTIGRDTIPKVWDLRTGLPITLSSPTSRGGVTRAAFSPDGRWVLTASLDGMARIWDASTGQAAGPPLPHGEAVQHAAFAPDGRHVVTVSLDGLVRVWDLTGSDPSPVAPWLSGAPPRESLYLTGERVIAFSGDGRRLAWTRWPDHSAHQVDTATARETAPHLPHEGWIGQIAFSPDGQLVVTASADRTARVWHVATGKPACAPLRHDDHVRHAEFDRQGRRVVTASVDKTARIWDAATGKALGEPMKHTRTVEYAAFSPDGSRIVTVASTDVQVWDAATGVPAGPVIAHRALVAHATLSPDGRLLATGTRDGAARVWKVETGQAVTPLFRHQRAVDCVCFSPNGRLLATASLDGTARVWDVTTGEPVTPSLHHGFRGKIHVAFTENGRRLVLTGDTRRALVWDLGSEGTDPADLMALADVLTAEKLRGLVGAGGPEKGAWLRAYRKLNAEQPARFVAGRQEVLAWHRRQAEDAERTSDWFASYWHAKRLVEMTPDDGRAWALLADAHAGLRRWDEAVAAYTKAIQGGAEPGTVWHGRGLAHAQRGDWKQAAADLQEAVERGTADWDVWYELALARVAGGDAAGYRAACAGLRKRFGRSSDTYNANTLAWICVLAPGGVDDPAWAVGLARDRVGTDPRGAGWTDAHLNTLGAALYRAGRLEEAVARLKDAIEAGRGEGLPQDWLFLAMAHARAGRDQEARKCLAHATQRIDRIEKVKVPPWTTGVEHRVLRLEAERVVNGTGPSGSGKE